MKTAHETLNGKFLYKFKAITTEEQMEQVKDIIKNQRVWCSRLCDLNDLLEGAPYYCIGKNKDDDFKSKLISFIFEIKKEREKDLDPKFEFYIKSLSIEEHINFIEKINKENIRWIHENFYIFCTTSAFDSHLMWAHYAESHKGIAIVFDSTKHEIGLSYKVNYTKLKNEIPIYESDSDLIMRESILTKLEEWGYEKEYRALVSPNSIAGLSEPKGNFLELPTDSFVGVVFGARISKDKKAMICEWVKEFKSDLLLWDSVIERNGLIKLEEFAL